MRHALALIAILLLTALLPCDGAAQKSVSLYPRSGLLAPDAFFYEQFASFVEAPDWSTGSLGRSLLVGAGVEIGFAESGLSIRGEIARSFAGWLLVSHSVTVPRQLFDPPEISVSYLDVPYTMTLTSLQAVLPTRLTLWGAQPYVAAGVGGKFYAFGQPTEADGGDAILPSEGFTWGGDLGAGFTLPVPAGFTLDVQARDAITRYWGKTQHDFLFTGGLQWRVR